LENAKCVGQGPECGRNHQRVLDVLVVQNGWAKPDEVNDKNARTRPVNIVKIPS
jgi:hypothetical protein